MTKLYIFAFIYLTYLVYTFCSPINKLTKHFVWPEFEGEFNMSSHLTYDHIRRICISRYSICKSNATTVCAVRFDNGRIQYRDFVNSCYLFLSNMCENPGNEHHIISGGSCESYKASRRSDEELVMAENSQDASANDTTAAEVTTSYIMHALRQKPTTAFSTLYDIDTAFDDHICPSSCPNVYEPICLSANRGFGEHFKFYTFVNHCLGDQYYCKHWQDFSPPPDESEMVTSSPLSWSFCGASRYIQFARFSEVASSMGHYGWLLGDQRAAHIMDPRDRQEIFRL